MATNNLINNSQITREEQHLFLNNTEIPGVQSIDMSYQTNSAPLKFIGMSGVQYIPVGPQIGEVSINSLLITTDQFLALTGNSGVNGYLFKTLAATGDNFGFTSGYLTSYASSCSIGQIPQIAANIQVFGNIGRIDSSESADVITNFNSVTGHVSILPLKIADPNSISLSLSDSTTNRVQSYNLNINVPRQANYLPGNRYPNSIEISYPIEVNMDFTLDYNDYVAKNMRDFPFNHKTNNIAMTLRDLETTGILLQYDFSGMQLVGERYSISTDGAPVRLNAKYQGYYVK